MIKIVIIIKELDNEEVSATCGSFSHSDGHTENETKVMSEILHRMSKGVKSATFIEADTESSQKLLMEQARAMGIDPNESN